MYENSAPGWTKTGEIQQGCGVLRKRSRGRSRIAARRGSGAVEEELWCTVGAGQRENSGLAESTGNVEMEQAVGYVSGIFFVVGDF